MSRVLLIGLDSADAELVEQWCDEGRLPALTQLRADGVWGRLRTTAEIMHVSAWPSIYTGTTPGHHGMYHAYQTRAGEQTALRTRPDWCARPPFWKLLDDAGRKCMVMDAFMDYRLEGFRGIQVLEYGTWTLFGEPGASPPGIRSEIVRRFGAYPSPEHSLVVNVPDTGWFRDRLLAGAEVKAQVVNWLLAEHPWDMAFVTFGEPHGAGHYLWHVGDATYPSHPAGTAHGPGQPLRDVYEAVDRAIGAILDRIDDQITVIVISGDGMGPNYAGSHFLPDVLHRLGLFRSANVGGGDGARARSKRGPLSTVRNAIPIGIRQSVTRCLPRSVQHKLSLKWASAGIDWQQSRVSCIPNANEGYLRVNLRGREPLGIVESGADYAQLLADLAVEMRGLRNPANGRSTVEQVFLIDEVFPGSERQHLPDLVVAWDPDARLLTEIATPRAGKVLGPAAYQTSPFYTGNHRPNAFVLARGPGIPAHAQLEQGHILDLAPTILTLLGVDSPASLEGRAWPQFVAT
jgi:predicted AlkP superfamily phosphohydrolase/phosphomutase